MRYCSTLTAREIYSFPSPRSFPDCMFATMGSTILRIGFSVLLALFDALMRPQDLEDFKERGGSINAKQFSSPVISATAVGDDGNMEELILARWKFILIETRCLVNIALNAS